MKTEVDGVLSLWTHGNARHGPVGYPVLAVSDETGPGTVLVRTPPSPVGWVDDMKPKLVGIDLDSCFNKIFLT